MIQENCFRMCGLSLASLRSSQAPHIFYFFRVSQETKLLPFPHVTALYVAFHQNVPLERSVYPTLRLAPPSRHNALS